MSFLRRHEITFAMAATVGVVWMLANAALPLITDGRSMHWSVGIVIAVFMITFGVVIGPPEERRRKRELRREAKREMREQG